MITIFQDVAKFLSGRVNCTGKVKYKLSGVRKRDKSRFDSEAIWHNISYSRSAALLQAARYWASVE